MRSMVDNLRPWVQGSSSAVHREWESVGFSAYDEFFDDCSLILAGDGSHAM